MAGTAGLDRQWLRQAGLWLPSGAGTITAPPAGDCGCGCNGAPDGCGQRGRPRALAPKRLGGFPCCCTGAVSSRRAYPCEECADRAMPSTVTVTASFGIDMTLVSPPCQTYPNGDIFADGYYAGPDFGYVPTNGWPPDAHTQFQVEGQLAACNAAWGQIMSVASQMAGTFSATFEINPGGIYPVLGVPVYRPPGFYSEYINQTPTNMVRRVGNSANDCVSFPFRGRTRDDSFEGNWLPWLEDQYSEAAGFFLEFQLLWVCGGDIHANVLATHNCAAGTPINPEADGSFNTYIGFSPGNCQGRTFSFVYPDSQHYWWLVRPTSISVHT